MGPRKLLAAFLGAWLAASSAVPSWAQVLEALPEGPASPEQATPSLELGETVAPSMPSVGAPADAAEALRLQPLEKLEPASKASSRGASPLAARLAAASKEMRTEAAQPRRLDAIFDRQRGAERIPAEAVEEYLSRRDAVMAVAKDDVEGVYSTPANLFLSAAGPRPPFMTASTYYRHIREGNANFLVSGTLDALKPQLERLDALERRYPGIESRLGRVWNRWATRDPSSIEIMASGASSDQNLRGATPYRTAATPARLATLDYKRARKILIQADRAFGRWFPVEPAVELQLEAAESLSILLERKGIEKKLAGDVDLRRAIDNLAYRPALADGSPQGAASKALRDLATRANRGGLALESKVKLRRAAWQIVRFLYFRELSYFAWAPFAAAGMAIWAKYADRYPTSGQIWLLVAATFGWFLQCFVARLFWRHDSIFGTWDVAKEAVERIDRHLETRRKLFPKVRIADLAPPPANQARVATEEPPDSVEADEGTGDAARRGASSL